MIPARAYSSWVMPAALPSAPSPQPSPIMPEACLRHDGERGRKTEPLTLPTPSPPRGGGWGWGANPPKREGPVRKIACGQPPRHVAVVLGAHGAALVTLDAAALRHPCVTHASQPRRNVDHRSEERRVGKEGRY